MARGGGRGGCAGRGWARPAEGCSAPRAPPAPSPQRRPAQRPSRAEPLLSVRRRQARSQTCPAAPEGAGGHARGSEWGSGTRSPVSPGAATPKCLFFIPNMYFWLPPSPPISCRRVQRTLLSVPGVGREEWGTWSLSYINLGWRRWIKRLPGSPPVSTGPDQA